jgi:hypothetical protein
MALHLARSGRCEGSREEGDNKMVLPVIFLRIVDDPILRGRESEIQRLPADQIHFLLGLRHSNRQKTQNEEKQTQPFPAQLPSHNALLSLRSYPSEFSSCGFSLLAVPPFQISSIKVSALPLRPQSPNSPNSYSKLLFPFFQA